MPSFELERRVSAPVDIVWEVLTDHRGYATWGAVKSATLETEGAPDVNGVGAVRRLADGPLVIREKVLEFEPKTRFVYTVLSGPPVRDYRATVTLSPDASATNAASATNVRWTVAFRAKIPFTGIFLRPVVKLVITTLLRKESVEAARRATQASQSPRSSHANGANGVSGGVNVSSAPRS
jgi:uncharacterized protein YndB with AHSA1/START domain